MPLSVRPRAERNSARSSAESRSAISASALPQMEMTGELVRAAMDWTVWTWGLGAPMEASSMLQT